MQLLPNLMIALVLCLITGVTFYILDNYYFNKAASLGIFTEKDERKSNLCANVWMLCSLIFFVLIGSAVFILNEHSPDSLNAHNVVTLRGIIAAKDYQQGNKYPCRLTVSTSEAGELTIVDPDSWEKFHKGDAVQLRYDHWNGIERVLEPHILALTPLEGERRAPLN